MGSVSPSIKSMVRVDSALPSDSDSDSDSGFMGLLHLGAYLVERFG